MNEVSTVASSSRPTKWMLSRRWLGRIEAREYLLLCTVVVLCIGISLGSGGNFLHAYNLSSLFLTTAITLVPAIGMTAVIVTGGIDVSVGSMLGLVAVLGGICFEHGWGLAAATPVFLLSGGLLGLLNGALITAGRIPPIITTLGTLSIFRAAAFFMLGNHWITMVPPSLTQFFVLQKLWVLPAAFLIALALLVAFAGFLNKVATGRHIYAIGNNENAARLHGIKVSRIKILTYTLTGVLVGISALLTLAQSPTVQSSTGTGFELTVIAAVVLGGTELTGGRGTLLGTLLGSLLVAIVENGVVLLHIQPFWSGVLLGGVIIVSVGLAAVRQARISRGNA